MCVGRCMLGKDKSVLEPYSGLRIIDLEMMAFVGILEIEQRIPQRLLVNADMEVSFDGVCANGEQLTVGVNYAAVAQELKRVITEGRFGLLEDLLEACIDSCFERFAGIRAMRLCVCKPDILTDCGGVEAVLVRRRS